MKLFHPIKIGNIELEGNLFLAPMAGYTDPVFRSICLSHGANLAYTEMVSAEGVARNNIPTMELARRAPDENILAVQLFGPDEEVLSRSIPNVMRFKADMLDINCGCPVPKVTKTGAGSALMKDPRRIGAMVSVLKRETGLPVTVKIRTGWDAQSLNYLECAEAAFSAGANALCMHARTRSQLYMPTAHWEYLENLKKHFPNQVIIGSGDLFCPEDAQRMLESTGVDAVSFARGAMGNPFIFSRTRALLEGRQLPVVPAQEKVLTLMEHLTRLAGEIGEERACREMRKNTGHYLKGIPGSTHVKRITCTATDISRFKQALQQLDY